MKRIVFIAFFACACGGAPGHHAAPAGNDVSASAKAEGMDTASLGDVIRGAHRSEKNRARDMSRHPEATLTFFGIAPDLEVVELWPGRGWYTEILAPYLRAHGKLTVVAPVPGSVPPQAPTVDTIRETLAARPDLYDRVAIAPVNPNEQPKFGAPGSADLVVTFRNAHNWIHDGNADAMFRAAFDVLRPGGTLGVVDHRAKAGTSPEALAKSGYVTEEQITALAKEAGFVFAAASEINANPRDTKDYPDGVWTLPPALRLGDKDRSKYEAIGESDRMTLRFQKPMQAKQKTR